MSESSQEQCYLCEGSLEGDRPPFSFDSNLGNHISLCGKCMHRFGIPAEEHPEELLEEVQSVVFGYKTNYRCPQCWEAIRFRGIFPRITQCSTTRQLIHKECGDEGNDGKIHMKNVLAELEDGKALDAPPERRCLSCHAPVDTENDKRFGIHDYACTKCPRSLCDRCKGDSLIQDGKVIDCKVCGEVKKPGLISKIYSGIFK